MSGILVSFVVPTRNRGALLEKTVLSILRQSRTRGAIEILVADNQSSDDTAERVGRLAATADCPIRFLPMPENKGPARSRNFGAALAQGRYIAFVDSDVELADGWLEGVLDAFALDPRIGMVAGKVVFASYPGIVHCFGGELSRLGLGWDAHQGEQASSLNAGEYRLWTPSASMMILRSLFAQLGGFDENFFFGYEDSDLGWRSNTAGWKCYLTPDAVAIHATTARIDDKVAKIDSQIVYHYSKNRVRSMLKNASGRELALWVPVALLYSLADCLRAPRVPRLRALLWNVKMLPDTLRERARIQHARVSGSWDTLFARSLFPPETLRRRLEERAVLHGSPVAGTKEIVS